MSTSLLDYKYNARGVHNRDFASVDLSLSLSLCDKAETTRGTESGSLLERLGRRRPLRSSGPVPTYLRRRRGALAAGGGV